MAEVLCRATIGYGNAKVGDLMLVDDSHPQQAPLIGVYFVPVDSDGRDLPRSEWPGAAPADEEPYQPGPDTDPEQPEAGEQPEVEAQAEETIEEDEPVADEGLFPRTTVRPQEPPHGDAASPEGETPSQAG